VVGTSFTSLLLLLLLLLLFLLLPLRAQGIRETLISLRFLNPRHTLVLLRWGIIQSQGHYLTQPQNKRKQTTIPWVRFESRISVFERAKAFRWGLRRKKIIFIITEPFFTIS
jgi:hypothetical protein